MGKIKSKSKAVTVSVSATDPNPERTPPIIVYFPSRFSPSESASVSVYKHVKRTNRFTVKVTPKRSDVQFVGTNYAGEASRPQLCSYALGVFNRDTNSLNLIPIAANKVFRLEPRVGEAEKLEDAPQNARTAITAKDTQNTYSTRKTEREHRKRDGLQTTDDAETRQHLDKKFEGITMLEEAPEVTVSSINERNVPPYNLEASDPSLVYPLERIIFKGEWEYLQDVFNISQGGGEVTAELYPNFVCNRVHKLEIMEHESEKKKLSGILSFITHLIKFKDKFSMDSVRSATRHQIPGILFQKFSSMFVDSESKVLSPEKIELLIGYVLVLTLFVDNFRTDLTDIAKDLKMPAGKLRSYYETIGCKLVREKQVLLATLPVPLTFPTTTKRQRRKS